MSQMEIFKNPEFGSIRVIEENGNYLFCGTDIAAALGYSNPRKAVRDHTRGGTKRSIGVQTGKKADGTPAMQMVEMLFIPEGDVYRLIVHSKLPSAERFEKWVFDEVLPTIRKHGAYITREKLWEMATSPEAMMKLCSDLLAEREKNAALREENALLDSKEDMQPVENFFATQVAPFDRAADFERAHDGLSPAEDAVGAVGVRGKGDHPPAQHKVPFKDVPRGQKVARAARRGVDFEDLPPRDDGG